MSLVGLGEDLLLEGDAELRAKGLELIEVLLVLGLVLDLGLDSCFGGKRERGDMLAYFEFFFPSVLFLFSSLTLKDADRGREVVDSPCGF